MYKRVLTVQDVSCLGQCSLTVALPILSASGNETCIIPSAVLSTHTGGFSGFTFRDLSSDIPKIREHWQKENIDFDAIYTGYLGSIEQINYIKDLFSGVLREGGKTFVDPAMADNGKLYFGFDDAYAKAMAELSAEADVILPNLTEACFMTGLEYKETYDEAYIDEVLGALRGIGCKDIVLTGIGFEEGATGVIVLEGNEKHYYKHKKISKGCHGTGDIFASAFVGAVLSGKTMEESAKIAADYTLACIENTIIDESHWYGAKFETALPQYIEALQK